MYSRRYNAPMLTGKIDGYEFAVIETTKLIAVRRPDGSLRMLPGADNVENAVRAFIDEDRSPDGPRSPSRPSPKD